jgi:hypothetical protein
VKKTSPTSNGQNLWRGSSRIQLRDDGFLDFIFVSVTDRGKLLIEFKIGDRKEWTWLYFDLDRTRRLISILSEGLPISQNAGEGRMQVGRLEFDISDWKGGPFDDYRGEVSISALKGGLEFAIRGHPKNDGKERTVAIDYRAGHKVLSSLKKSIPYLKEVAGRSNTRPEPKDMVGRLVRYDVEPSETPGCPRFPPARVTKVIQGQYPQPNYIIEFAEPVMWKRNEGYDVRYLGMKCAALMSRYYDRIEELLENKKRRFPLVAHLAKFKAKANPYEIEIARVGTELEGDFCWGYVSLCKPRKRLLKKFEETRTGHD